MMGKGLRVWRFEVLLTVYMVGMGRKDGIVDVRSLR